MVAETREPGVTVSLVARRRGVSPNQLFTWRQLTESKPRLATFLAWAKEHLAKHEARLSAQAIEDRFEAERLFGHDDYAIKLSAWL
jgi:transposase-like protein